MADTYVGKPIGVSNLTWFPLTADPAEGSATYGTAVKLSRLIEVTLDPQFVEGLLESDDSIEDQISLLQSVDVTINASQLTDAIRAELLGHTMDSTGGMLVKPTDAPQLGALAFKALLSKESGADKHVYIVLYKGRFREFSETFSTLEKGAVKYQTHTGLRGTFVARDSDGHIMYRMREDSSGASSTKASAWFTAPQEYTPPSP